ncbi:hypothetical protein K0038_00624 [Pseudomonas syringae]|nr:hypothetical protein [Pseudomonas syringae]
MWLTGANHFRFGAVQVPLLPPQCLCAKSKKAGTRKASREQDITTFIQHTQKATIIGAASQSHWYDGLQNLNGLYASKEDMCRNLNRSKLDVSNSSMRLRLRLKTRQFSSELTTPVKAQSYKPSTLQYQLRRPPSWLGRGSSGAMTDLNYHLTQRNFSTHRSQMSYRWPMEEALPSRHRSRSKSS